MFSTFPDGWSGAGLLLLRAAAGVVLIVQGIACLENGHDRGALISVVAGLAIAVGTLLLLGCLTRFAAVLAVAASVACMLSWFPGPNVGFAESTLTATLAGVIAIAILCLGPGAFSVDARLFGRREIIIPHSSSSP
jgi:uncharacterized membrane protein YphA (DoxX/SURF4 family)